ncbi:MAG: hypothetical protein KY469_04155 [Actinobacteria bacterium]|nr:hypothetical protein [Actinomycetota bacterium]
MGSHARDLSRRAFIRRVSGTFAAAGVVATAPDLLRWGARSDAAAQTPDIVLDTFRGFAAMVFPGDDDYSVAQQEATDGPGAVAAGAAEAIIAGLDFFVPAPDQPVPNDETLALSQLAAGGMNSVALTVNPAAAGGAFPSPFARLSFDEKIETWRVLEEDTRQATVTDDLASVQLLYGLLPGFVQFFAFTELSAWDPQARALTGRPVGWEHAGYQPGRTVPVEGWDEFKGYWADRRAADPT